MSEIKDLFNRKFDANTAWRVIEESRQREAEGRIPLPISGGRKGPLARLFDREFDPKVAFEAIEDSRRRERDNKSHSKDS